MITPFLEINTEHNEQPCGVEEVKLLSQANFPATNYLWYLEGFPEPIGDGTFLFTSTPGIYWVEADGPCGRVQSERFILSDQEVFVPEMFSPNGDGNNDHFVICYDTPENIQTIELNIFDKNGSLVYTNSSIEEVICQDKSFEKGWDGGEFPSDTFIWTLKVLFKSCGEVRRKGFVRLIR